MANTFKQVGVDNIPTDSDFGGMIQAGSTDTLSDVGIRTVSQTYVNKAGQMKLPAPQEQHPTFKKLYMKSATITKQKGGMEALSVVYEGPGDEGTPESLSGTAGNPLFRVVRTIRRPTRQEPLDSHPEFAADIKVAAQGGSADDDENPEIIIRNKDGAFVRISDKAEDASLRGASSYLVPSAEYTLRYAATSQPNLSNVGKIRTPPGLTGFNAPGSANWMFVGIESTQKGQIYEVMEKYLLSGPNGWAESVYKSID